MDIVVSSSSPGTTQVPRRKFMRLPSCSVDGKRSVMDFHILSPKNKTTPPGPESPQMRSQGCSIYPPRMCLHHQKELTVAQRMTNFDREQSYDQLLSLQVFNDSVHGHIEMHPLLVSNIDTPEFQRLRFIKQLGMCYFVYPGASHNRFEHSLGVSYLAGELARSLQSKQKNLKITKEDILCVEIAGLCHDLGHGPFSHLFDEAFLPKVRPDYKGKHEKLSVDMFEHMLKKNNLREQFQKYKLTEGDNDFIKEQIFGVGEKKVRAVCTFLPEEGKELPINKNELLTLLKRDTQEGFLEVANEEGERGIVSKEMVEEIWSYKGRGKDKSYLYEIVATNVMEITNLIDMFHTRYTLHRRAYQHRVNKILEAMIVEALKEANDYLLFPGKDGKMKKMSESIDDMEAYSKLNDHIMWTILCTTDDKLKKSRDLVNRILTRDLFVCVGQTQLKKKIASHETPMKLVSQLIDIDDCTEKEIFERLSGKAKKTIKQSDIIVHIANFSYGMGEKDPVEHVKFYSKYDPNNTVEISKIRQESMALPREFSERFLRVCVKQTEPEVSGWVCEAFEEWCIDKGLTAKPGEFSAGISWTKKPSSLEERKLHAGNASKRLGDMYDSTPLSRK
ncbi:putative deoxynucleoside triphosphate triphosphohydrolase SAMHD1-like [Apostichopus japonicus]|uniref:Putative deoxynucleoside triphosphate triphosphohydrolase SAMHD1-like n=1 Tax=Stichopus japonicus TaxID=307972 RepID=A0A2G8K1W5_STIJA|nr:putative deoxynucleoside triphosphate triphosphohydrolase SAMHD1-like [Apostichopus japonicus]